MHLSAIKILEHNNNNKAFYFIIFIELIQVCKNAEQMKAHFIYLYYISFFGRFF